MATATETPVTLELLAKELKALRKDIRKVRAHLEDPTGEKAAARAKSNGFNKPLDVTEKLRTFLSLGADEKISRLVEKHFDLRPKGIIMALDLLRPIYTKTASYGHFGRDEPEFTWEAIDKVELLKSAAGL